VGEDLQIQFKSSHFRFERNIDFALVLGLGVQSLQLLGVNIPLLFHFAQAHQ